MKEITLKGRTIVEGHCQGEALVSMKPISFLGGVDPAEGKIIEKGHDLFGKCVRGKVLCFPHGHGSTVGSYVLYSLAKKNLAPEAIINQTADPVVVVGAIIANVPMITEVDIKQIQTGDFVEIDTRAGLIKVQKTQRS
jgi:predicted aconitase with swiveling domain